jgi:N-acylneuraminate cytidylyltransferase
MSKKYACLIPARGNSKRFPRKNIALLKGKPVLGYVIEAALSSKLFPDVWVSTDDAEIASVARQFGAKVHTRPPALAADNATMMDVCLNFMDGLDKQGQSPEVFCLMLPTAALVRAEDLTGAARLLDEKSADMVMAVTSYLESPFWALHESAGFLKTFFGQEYLVASQKLPKVCVDNGYFYFAKTEALRREKTWYSQKLVGFPIPRERSMDIDEPAHLIMAEALMDAQEKLSAEAAS